MTILVCAPQGRLPGGARFHCHAVRAYCKLARCPIYWPRMWSEWFRRLSLVDFPSDGAYSAFAFFSRRAFCPLLPWRRPEWSKDGSSFCRRRFCGTRNLGGPFYLPTVRGDPHRTLGRPPLVSFGESVEIPETDEPIWAEIDVPLSVAGRAASLLLCVPQISLHLRSEGQDRQYRFLADTARAGFLLSPLITTPASFCSLYPDGRIADARAPRVESLGLVPPAGPAFYKQSIEIRLYRLLIHW